MKGLTDISMQQPLYDVPNISDFRDMIDQSTLRHGKNNAFMQKDADGRITAINYEQLRHTVDVIGSALLNMGLHKKKIVLCGENSSRWCMIYLAVCCGVGVIVPADKELPATEIANIIAVSGAELLIADARTLKKLENEKQLKKGLSLVCLDGDFDGAATYESLLDKGESLLSEGKTKYLNAKIDPDELSVLLFTSGTTGMAKGVMLSQKNICSDIMSASSIIRITSTDMELSVLPLHHAYECLVFLCFIYAGGCIAFCGGLRHLSQGFNDFSPTIICAVPLIVEKLHAKIMASPAARAALSLGKTAASISGKAGRGLDKVFYSGIRNAFGGKLRCMIVGAASLNPRVAADFKALGMPVIVGYGMTECSPIIICNNDTDIRFDSIGRPIPGAEAKIINEDESGTGEICVRGPMVMRGYYNNPVATAAAMKDGWLRTGDLGKIDSEGFFSITGRVKNIILTKNGKNIYPEEPEYYLCSCDAIAEAVVYGEEGEHGTIVAAEIFPDRDKIKKRGKDVLTKDEIQSAVMAAVRSVNRKLPGYENIQKVVIRETEFPKTTTQKIKRQEK